MTDAPKRIWAWIDDLAGVVGTLQKPETPAGIPAGPNAITVTAEYTRADLIDMDALRRVEAALAVYADGCEATETTPCGYEGNQCCKTAKNTLTDLRAMMEKLK